MNDAEPEQPPGADARKASPARGGAAAMFAVGVCFLILGVSVRGMLPFAGVGAAFLAIAAGMYVRARKSDAGREGLRDPRNPDSRG